MTQTQIVNNIIMSSPSFNAGGTSSSDHGGGFGHGDAAAASALLSMQLGASPRTRAMSVDGGVAKQPPQTQQVPPTASTNVGELVVKAKKAAVSLWMILHAQNCRLPSESCPHRGCAETKLLLCHVKSCPAGPNFPCPTQCKGCNETRKLLAHYRRCKDMRVKQVGLGRRSGLQPDQSCLVCSLMARYAKSKMECSTKSNVASLLTSSAEGKFNVPSLANFSDQARTSPTVKQYPRRTPSITLMPPPPPRSRAIPISSPSLSAGIDRNGSDESFGSPPNSYQLMHSKIAAVAAITDPRTSTDRSRLSDPSLLGKSVDSSVSVPFPILKKASREHVVSGEELVVPGHSNTTANIRRQRAESYDERKSPSRVKFAPNLIASKQYYLHDEPGIQSEPMPHDEPEHNARPRSASCSVMGRNDSSASLSSNNGCETIAEEGAEHEEPVFDMED